MTPDGRRRTTAITGTNPLIWELGAIVSTCRIASVWRKHNPSPCFARQIHRLNRCRGFECAPVARTH